MGSLGNKKGQCADPFANHLLLGICGIVAQGTVCTRVLGSTICTVVGQELESHLGSAEGQRSDPPKG